MSIGRNKGYLDAKSINLVGACFVEEHRLNVIRQNMLYGII